MRRQTLSVIAAALLLLFAAAFTLHANAHGPDQNCALCHATPHPEPFTSVTLLETPSGALTACVPPVTEVNQTLAEVETSMSFRGPPALLGQS